MQTTESTRRSKALILATIALALQPLCGAVTAMPPYPCGPEEESSLEATEAVERQFAQMMSEWSDRGIDQPSDIDIEAWLASTATASKNMLCILIEFADKPSITDALFFDTLVYADLVGTVRHYYSEVSYGQLDIVTVNLPSTLGWVNAENDATYYTNGSFGFGGYPRNCQKLVEEAVDLVDSQVDFADYDNDGDGWVDGLIVVHAGRGAELTHSPDDIWSHKWAISPRLKDDTFVFDYSMMPEYWYSSRDMTCGVFCHELGHVFGLPDLYDRDYSSNGIGRWSLMASGAWNGSLGSSPAHPDAWSRIQLGFTTPVNVSSTTYGAELPDVQSHGVIYRLWTNGSDSQEYYLVENRRKTGYDAALPAEGLLIWHIDDNVSHNDNEWYPGHTESGHYAVALVQADGNWSLEKSLGQGDGGDPYPGASENLSFTPLSEPNSDSYDGEGSLVGVLDISDPADTMTADFVVSFTVEADEVDSEIPRPAYLVLEQNYPNPFNSSTTIEYTLEVPCEVRIEVLNLLGQTVYDLGPDTQPRGTHRITWSGIDDRGNEMPAGAYFYRLTSGGHSHVRKMLFLK